MTNVEKIHRIFFHQKGRDFAGKIKNKFETGSYKVQFQLHELDSANMMDINESGVSILLLTPQLLDAIKSGNHPNLDTLFQNPKFSVVLCHCIDRDKSQVSKILSDKLKGFLHWTYINFCSHDDLTDLKLNIMSLVEKSEGVEDVPTTPRLQNFKLWPGEDCKPKQSISLLFTRPVDDDDDEVKVKVIQKGCSVTLDALRLNRMTYVFNIGDIVDGMKTIEVFVNKSSYGRAQLRVVSKMEELEHLLHDVTNPIELLCQSMHFENREDLDLELLDLLSNYSSSGPNSLFSTFDWNKFGETVSKSELPTLLHFGAKFGLVYFCRQLLALPGGRQAMKMKNNNKLLPHEIAKENGFDSLASELRKQYDGCDEEEDYRLVASPFNKSARGSVSNFGSSPSRDEVQEMNVRESGDSGVQICPIRSGRSSASSSPRENSRSSLRSSSSESDIEKAVDQHPAQGRRVYLIG
ncbi:hypothetical protein CHS0354_024943 [Potamilus streckersoni]|uniref:DBB domain-containing protein n=1 Tax=Potamilus streckersoni TaxID=2493646 RepID=A0AAE0SRD6_9BIVA|nr:hypothetical protein CHS0354_024943 [Potamilus streckersoni]